MSQELMRELRQSPNTSQLHFFFKKCLLFFISLIELNKLYANSNSQKNIFNHFVISNNTQNIYLQEIKEAKRVQLPICPSLLSIELEELINLFRFNDLQFYFKVNRIFIKKKFDPKVFNLKNKIKIEYSHQIKDRITCSKLKRRDEILKFSYKFIRRNLILNFARLNQMSGLSFSQKKKSFEKAVLGNDKTLKSNFFCYEVSKKNLEYLRDHPLIGPKIQCYYRNSYLKDLVKETIDNDYDFVFNKKNTIHDFLEILYCVQLKKNINILDIFTSYEVLGQYLFRV